MKQLIMISLIISLATSCKKEENNPDPAYPSYLPLKAGNYWIYQYYDASPSGWLNPLNVYDSCYVEKDTVIAGRVYFKMYNEHPFIPILSIKYLRDSFHYIVNSHGVIEFSSVDFTTVFNTGYYKASIDDTICSYQVKMEDKDFLVATPAGIFPTSGFRSTLRFYPDWVVFNLYERAFNTRYSKNVGIVTQAFPAGVSDSVHLEKRLVRYSVN